MKIDLIRAELNVNQRHIDRYFFLSRNCNSKKAGRQYTIKSLPLHFRNIALVSSLMVLANHVMFSKYRAAMQVEEGDAVVVNEKWLVEKASGDKVSAVALGGQFNNNALKVEIL